MIYKLFFLFWFVRELKEVLFWLYLWQLKEYHTGRLADYFRTFQGKKAIFNFLNISKLLLFLSFTFSQINYYSFFVALFFLYFLEFGKFFFDLISKKLLKPVLTIKTIFLFLFVCLITVFYFLTFFFTGLEIQELLFFDLITSLVVSVVVLFFQPISFLWRMFIIEKAKTRIRGMKDLLVIGITGSYGKTSTKEFLYEILSKKFNVLKTKEHQNSEIGIAKCVLNDLNPNHDIFIVEMGAYNRGGIKMLTNIVQPKIGILTGLNDQHLSTFGSFQNTIKTKFELIESLPEDGTAILNGSNKFIWSLKPKIKEFNPNIKNVLFCSVDNKKTNIYVDSIEEGKSNLRFNVVKKDLNVVFNLSLIGRQNIENALLAICCANELGMNLEEISNVVNGIRNMFGSVKLLEGINRLDVVSSTYSANPSGVIAHVNHLKNWEGKRAVIMPCLIELGESSSENHRKIGERIGKVCDLAIVTTKEKFEEIQKGAVESGMDKDKVIFSQSPKKILDYIKDFKEGDVVLLEGRLPKKIKDKILK